MIEETGTEYHVPRDVRGGGAIFPKLPMNKTCTQEKEHAVADHMWNQSLQVQNYILRILAKQIVKGSAI